MKPFFMVPTILLYFLILVLIGLMAVIAGTIVVLVVASCVAVTQSWQLARGMKTFAELADKE